MNYEIGQLIAQQGYRGSFPWAANYDNFQNPLVAHLIRGMNS